MTRTTKKASTILFHGSNESGELKKKSHTAIKFYDGKMMIYALEILRMALSLGECWSLCAHSISSSPGNLFAKLTHLKQTKIF